MSKQLNKQPIKLKQKKTKIFNGSISNDNNKIKTPNGNANLSGRISGFYFYIHPRATGNIPKKNYILWRQKYFLTVIFPN